MVQGGQQRVVQVSWIRASRVYDRADHLNVGDQQAVVNVARCDPLSRRVAKLSEATFDAEFDDGLRSEAFKPPLPVGFVKVTVALLRITGISPDSITEIPHL